MQYVTLNNGVKMPIFGYKRMIGKFDIFDFELMLKGLDEVCRIDKDRSLFFLIEILQE